MDGMSELTGILSQIESGDSLAATRLLPLVYDELRKLAAAKLAHEQPGQTLQATALVHEAYLRLVGKAGDTRWDNSGHFFAAAAEAMRQILVNNAIRKKRSKHGGDRERMELDSKDIACAPPNEDILELDAALTRLAAAEPLSAEVVKLKYFAGLSLPQVAAALGISPRTADRRWAYARAWLHQDLTRH
jgi:RNA polymerase sigma factor (TIGR02999 family)